MSKGIVVTGNVNKIKTFCKQVARQIVEQHPDYNYEWSCLEALHMGQWDNIVKQAMEMCEDFQEAYSEWEQGERENYTSVDLRNHGHVWFVLTIVDDHTESFWKGA